MNFRSSTSYFLTLQKCENNSNTLRRKLFEVYFFKVMFVKFGMKIKIQKPDERLNINKICLIDQEIFHSN